MDDEQVPFNRGVVRPVACLTEGWDLIKDNYWLFLGIPLVGYLIASFAPMAILLGPMMCGIFYCLLRQYRGREIRFEMLFRGFDYFLQSLIATVIMIVPMMVISIAYIVFIVVLVISGPPGGAGPSPGVFFGGMGLFYLTLIVVGVVVHVLSFFVYPLIVDGKLTGVRAVTTSLQAAMSNLGGVVGLVLLTMVLEVAGAFACCVGAYFVLPIHFAAVAVAYRKVFPDERTPVLPPSEGPEADYGPAPGADDA